MNKDKFLWVLVIVMFVILVFECGARVSVQQDLRKDLNMRLKLSDLNERTHRTDFILLYDRLEALKSRIEKLEEIKPVKRPWWKGKPKTKDSYKDQTSFLVI